MTNLLLMMLLLAIVGSCQLFASAFVSPSSIVSSSSSSSSLTTTTATRSLAFLRLTKEPPLRSRAVFMGWGPEPIWSPAQVLSVQDACVSGKSVSVMVQVSPDLAEAYTVPGQYVQIRPAAVEDGATVNNNAAVNNNNNKPLFLAIASSPNPESSQFEFLIKKTPDNAWLTTATAPSSSSPSFAAIEISQILGKGFDVTEHLDGFKYDFPTQNVLLFAAGSGIAPIKAALEASNNMLQIAKPGQGGRSCRLYYGEQTPDDLCFVHKFSQWEANGIQVVPVISQLDEKDNNNNNDSWQGRTGYVQNALEEDGVAIPRNSAALLCGMKGMVESVTAILTKAGVFSGRVLTNF